MSASRVPDDMEIGPGDRGGAEFVYAALPAVAIDDAFAGSGWKTTGLGRCALHIDASGKEAHGFVVHGKPGDPRDAAMRVVASARGALFVEVEDDRKVGPSARWIADDHLEIWMAKQMPSYMDHCLEPGEKPVQWGIRLADAKVFPGAGNPDPTALTVERAEAPGGIVRLKITLPPKHEGLSVVYSDSDDGRKQERLIATSRLRFNDAPTLGRLHALSPDEVTCLPHDGKLEPSQKPLDPARFTEDP